MANEFTLASDFAPATHDDWLEAVARALKGADYERTLVSTTADGIRIEPLYTGADTEAGADDGGFPGFEPLLRGSSVSPRPDGAWDIRTRIAHPDPGTANAQALADLGNGATSVEFTGVSATTVPALLAGIVLDAAPVSLRAGAEGIDAARAFLALAEPGDGPTGCLGLDPIDGGPEAAACAVLAAEVAARNPGVRTFIASGATVADAGASEGQEIGYLLGAATQYLRAATGAGLTPEQAARQICLEVTADVDIFTTIAKTRALRFAWAAVLASSGVAVDDNADGIVSIVATSSYRSLTQVDPWVNLLRGTAACLGAVLGGADAVVVAPFDSVDALPGDLGRRMARNTQLILQDESGIGRVLDPAGGSWYVEALTDQLAAAGWEQFQRIEAAGGPAAAMAALSADIDVTAAELADAVAHRRRPITGVSEFPLLGEDRPDAEPAPAATPGLLPKRRIAAPFETLRSRGESSGQKVFLGLLGPASASTARATFAANLFAAGGIGAVSRRVDAGTAAEEFQSSGAAVACLCSSDAVYDEQAEQVAAALRQAGARRVYLAGKAEVPGVDETIALGADALEVLTRLQQTLEIA